MAYPFFSGQIQTSSENDGELNEIQIYHRLLLAYPAYTIDCIEAELSWRQVELLLACWEEEPPTVVRIARIENMLEKKLGYKSISTTTKALSGNDLVDHLERQGLL